MNSYDLAEIWVRCKDKLKESFNEKVFNVWIKPIMPLEVTDTYYKVAVKNDFFKTMLEENYAQVIEGVLGRHYEQKYQAHHRNHGQRQQRIGSS